MSLNKCPIGLDDDPKLCSAGTCFKCKEMKKSWTPSKEEDFFIYKTIREWLKL